MQNRRPPFETQLIRLSLFASVPLLLLLIGVMIYADISIYLILLTVLLGVILVAYTNTRIHQKSAYQFRSLSNLLEAMIKGDYSLRARSAKDNGALDELVASINSLARRLSQQRLESVESQLLVQTIIEHIDVAIIALNQDNHISFANPAARTLLQIKDSIANTELLTQLALLQSFSAGSHQLVELSLGQQQGRFNVHVEEYRAAGKQHKLLFITDVRTLLRNEERKAWQNLVRVISHEINNSLTPITSISQTLNRMISKQGCNQSTQNDLVEGLNIISQRSNGLAKFVSSYKQLAKLPEPEKLRCSMVELVKKTTALFEPQEFVIQVKSEINLMIDPVQFEQVLINLIKNAIEAMQQANIEAEIQIKCELTANLLQLSICDQGPGISNPENLFVPFYSTKSQGSGIGLVFCRQIIEAHHGQLLLINRTSSQGCCAIIEIPLTP